MGRHGTMTFRLWLALLGQASFLANQGGLPYQEHPIPGVPAAKPFIHQIKTVGLFGTTGIVLRNNAAHVLTNATN
jgi:hypothetical protein